jgi:non-ribosomal peptide synthetase component F/acyl carrier protein
VSRLTHLSAKSIQLLGRRLKEKKERTGGALRRLDSGAERYPVTYGQQGMWLVQQQFPGSPSFNTPVALRLRIPLLGKDLAQIFNHLAQRHEVLRTTYRMTGGKVEQVIGQPAVALDVLDLRALDRAAREPAAFAAIWERIARCFDLANGPLWTVTLITLDSTESILLIVMHHSICDAWSRNILISEAGVLLNALLLNLPTPELPPLPLQYGDYARWQREAADSVIDSSMKYWQEALRGYRGFELPTDYPRSTRTTLMSRSAVFRLSRATVDVLRNLGRSEGASMFMTLLAAFLLLLQRYCAQDDIAVGYPLEMREHVDLEPLAGYFVNILVLRADLHGGPSFRRVLRTVRDTCMENLARKGLSLERLIQGLKLHRDPQRNPLVQVSFQLEEGHSARRSDQPSESGFEYLNFDHFPTTTTNLDLMVHLYGDWESAHLARSDDMRGVFTYDAHLFEPQTIERLVTHYGNLLRQVADRPDAPVSDLVLTDAAERAALATWGASTGIPQSGSIIETFEAWVRTTPAAIALVVDGGAITYAALNALAARLARELRRSSDGAGTLIGLVADHGAELAVGMLGILKAGHAFVRFSATESPARQSRLIRQSGISRAVVQGSQLQSWPTGIVAAIPIDMSRELEDPSPDWGVSATASPENLAYALWTWRFDGDARLASHTHGGLQHMLHSMRHLDARPSARRVLQRASSNAALSVVEILYSLSAGASVVAFPGDKAVGERELPHFLTSHGVDTAFLHPDELDQMSLCHGLQRIFCVSEVPQRHPIIRPGESARRPEVYHVYAPAETGFAASWCARVADGERTGPVGRPLPNVGIYVVDSGGQLAGIGTVGEILIASPNVYGAYLDRADLTADRWIPDSFGGRSGSRLYRTGDRGRWLRDGSLEYLGRSEGVMPFRNGVVDPADMEAALREHVEISQAVVMVREHPRRGEVLVAYVEVERGIDRVDEASLSQFMASRFPAAQVPTDWVISPELPRGHRGTVDRDALDRIELSESWPIPIPPRNATEARLMRIVSTVLARTDVGACDDFFWIGGHSLLMLELLTCMQQEFGVEISLHDAFAHSTVAGLAELVEAAVKSPLTGKAPGYLVN